MKRLLISSFSILVICFFACSPSPQIAHVLELRAVTTELFIPFEKDSKLEPCLHSCQEIIYRLVNNSDQELLLYNFRRNFNFGLYEKGLTCDTVWNLQGKTIYLFTQDLNFRAPSPGIHDSTTISASTMERQMTMAKTWYRNSRVVLESGMSVEFRQTIDFRDYEIPPGTYYIKLGYMQIGIPPEIAPDELRSDLGSASLFSGCLWSDVVKLVVKSPL